MELLQNIDINNPYRCIIIDVPIENVHIEISGNSRKIDGILEEYLTSEWQSLLQFAKENGRTIYDGEAYRFENFEIKNGELYIKLGSIKYSERAPMRRIFNRADTNAPKDLEFVRRLLHLGSDYFTNGIAAGGFIKTSDNKFIFGIRGGKSLTEGKRDFIGGIFETEGYSSDNFLKEHIEKEIKEEVNIFTEDLLETRMVAIIQADPSEVILLSLSFTKLTSEQVLEKFNERKDLEMAGLEFVEPNDLRNYMNNLGGYKTVCLELADKVIKMNP